MEITISVVFNNTGISHKSFIQYFWLDIHVLEFIKDLVQDWKITKGRDTPARPNLFEIDDKAELLNYEDKKKFHRGVAQALYLAGRTRGDILCPIIFLTSRVQEPTVQDRTKLIHVSPPLPSFTISSSSSSFHLLGSLLHQRGYL